MDMEGDRLGPRAGDATGPGTDFKIMRATQFLVVQGYTALHLSYVVWECRALLSSPTGTENEIGITMLMVSSSDRVTKRQEEKRNIPLFFIAIQIFPRNFFPAKCTHITRLDTFQMPGYKG
ncbi:hypothetical protein SAY87_021271 [Trapa incisa]|uniref:Uncharacterized protein n=1 Tax=Trapa incisa TaxID=236973 RepID=A0AAN7JRW1_9MYRT|nr:hypothetical protein SAY87_021271 [Trapa incisa]